MRLAARGRGVGGGMGGVWRGVGGCGEGVGGMWRMGWAGCGEGWMVQGKEQRSCTLHGRLLSDVFARERLGIYVSRCMVG